MEALAPREMEILQLVANGYANKEIADKMSITLSTVCWYLHEIYKKLHVQSRVQARVLILTLKLNDRRIEQQIPRFMKQIEMFAPSPVRATQLPANRAEFCVVAGEFMHRMADRSA